MGPASRGTAPDAASLILGTAGHIDHGKTALVRALTGIDTDRLPEERARGITTDLGFAPLALESGLRLSVVDVPGHEGLVRTMVAGASGIDLVLLVVAADEGVMPQTREHVAICHLLGISHALVALSKIDLVDDEVAALAADEVADLLGDTRLAGAPLIPVSAATGAGLDALRAAIGACAAGAAPRTPRSGPARLHVDRSFALRGIGCVVTGTLVGGALRAGDSVVLLPAGQRARVRGIQTHGADRARVEPGARCALNLHGVEVGQISRGDVVCLPDDLEPTTRADVSLAWLESAPPLEEAAAVELLVGTCERRARVTPIGAARLRAGERGFARLHVEGDALPLLPGDRFVLRGFARTAQAGATLGGGEVLDVAPPHRRRSDPALLRDLETLAKRDAVAGLRVRVARSGFSGCSRERLRRETGLTPPALDAALLELGDRGGAAAAGEVWIGDAALAALERRLLAELEAFHRSYPLRPGMPAGALRGSLPGNVAPELSKLALESLASRGAICARRDILWVSRHRPRLGATERRLAAALLESARNAALEPASPGDWSEQLGIAPDRLRELLAHLEREGALVRAPGDLWFAAEAVAELRERVLARLRERGRLETPEYKALIGTSRRSAVPLMELFDAERLTLRRGNARVLRKTREG